MPRTKKAVRDQQVYKLAAYGAIVTIDYDVSNPPPFFQPGAGIVIVGEHQCAPLPIVLHDPTAYPPPYSEVTLHGGNFGVDETDPEYVAFKARQGGAARGPMPAPPGVSPKVHTSEDNFGMPAGSGELSRLLDGAAAPVDAEES